MISPYPYNHHDWRHPYSCDARPNCSSLSHCLQAFQLGTVISNGVGKNLSVNALYAGPYATLVSNVYFGAAQVPYAPSGAGPKASSFLTFWNVQVSLGMRGLSGMVWPVNKHNDARYSVQKLIYVHLLQLCANLVT